jgi:Fibronectin type III domain
VTTASGTIITPTSGGTLTDASGSNYTMNTGGGSPGEILRNGTVIPGSGGTQQCIICSGVVYAENAPSGPWYSLSGTTFTQISGTPPCFGTPTAPGTPTGLTIGTVTSSTIGMNWTADSGATSYNVLMQTGGTGSYVNVGTPTTNSFTATGLSASTAYSFEIEGVNTGGTSGPSTAAGATTAASGGGVTVASVQAQISNAETLAATLSSELASIFTNVGQL